MLQLDTVFVIKFLICGSTIYTFWFLILHSPYSVPTHIVFSYCITNSMFLFCNSHFLLININIFLFIISIFDDLSSHFSTFYLRSDVCKRLISSLTSSPTTVFPPLFEIVRPPPSRRLFRNRRSPQRRRPIWNLTPKWIEVRSQKEETSDFKKSEKKGEKGTTKSVGLWSSPCGTRLAP